MILITELPQQHLEYETHNACPENDRDDVPPPFRHTSESDHADDDRKPINDVRRWKDNMQSKPNCQIQDDANDGCSNGGQCGRQTFVTAQFFDVRASQEYPQKTRCKRGPGRY